MPRWEYRQDDLATILAVNPLPQSFDDVTGNVEARSLFATWSESLGNRDGDNKPRKWWNIWRWVDGDTIYGDDRNRAIADNVVEYAGQGVPWPDGLVERLTPPEGDGETEVEPPDYEQLLGEAATFAAEQLKGYVSYFSADVDGVQRSRQPQLTRDRVDLDLVDGINSATMKSLDPMTSTADLIPFLLRDDVLLIGDGHSSSHMTWAKAGGMKGRIGIGANGSGLDPGTVLVVPGPQMDEDAVKAAVRRFSKKKIVYGHNECAAWLQRNR